MRSVAMPSGRDIMRTVENTEDHLWLQYVAGSSRARRDGFSRIIPQSGFVRCYFTKSLMSKSMVSASISK